MANQLNLATSFVTGGTVDAASLNNLINTTTVNSAIIKNQNEITTIGTADFLLIAPDSVDSSLAPRKVTVQNLFDDGLTAGTFTNLNLTGALTYGTATGNRTISTSATITNLSNTSGTIATLNSTTGTITTLNSTTGTITTLNSTTGTIATINSTTGTIATLKSTTGTIGNLSTTLTGDLTISQGTATLATSGATAGTYGSVTAIPFITVDAKGRVTSATTGTFSSTPADGSITPAKLSQPFTSGTAVASTSGTAIDFTGIPSWVKRITVMLFNVSVDSTSNIIIQLGTTSGIVSTGYASYSALVYGANLTDTRFSGDGLIITSDNTNQTRFGSVQISNINSNTWISSHSMGWQNTGGQVGSITGGGGISLAGTLDRIRLTTVSGTNNFDLGTVNIMYEG